VSLLLVFVLFFFSSRRRHTRSDRDWSSDVCSSDLEWKLPPAPANPAPGQVAVSTRQGHGEPAPQEQALLEHPERSRYFQLHPARSEERRVGKECRAPVGEHD